jgi:hypothetical protein
MIPLRAVGVLMLWLMPTAPAFSGYDLHSVIDSHPIWIQRDLTFEKDPGAKQDWAGGRVLYFGSDGTFGMLGGIIIRRAARFTLSGGDGEVIYAGKWSIREDEIEVDYRLVGAYKVMRPTGEKPLEIPGPVQHADLKPDLGSVVRLQLEGASYEIGHGWSASELRSRIRIYNDSDSHRLSKPQ